MPTACEDVPAQILDPANTWPRRDDYLRKYHALAARFVSNFKLMEDGCPEYIVAAGPRVDGVPV